MNHVHESRLFPVFIGVGSNVGIRESWLKQAESRFRAEPAFRQFRKAPVYETDSVGGPPQGKFLNTVWAFETAMPAMELLHWLQALETELGRVRDIPQGPRTLDLDLLAYGNRILESPEMTLPHPRMHERTFVLQPLADLEPGWTHPVLNKTATELLEACLERNS